MSDAVGIGKVIEDQAEIRKAQRDREDEIIRLIGEHLREYREGGPDREAEDIELSKGVGVDIGIIEDRWRVARYKRQKPQTQDDGSLKKPEVQPSVEPAKVEPPKAELKIVKPAPRKVKLKLINGVWYEVTRERRLRRWTGPSPKVEPRIEPQIELKPQQQAKPEPEPEPKTETEQAKEEEVKAQLPALVPRTEPAGWDDALTVLNRQHAIIENVGGKAVIASWEPSTSTVNPTKLVVVFQNKDSFLLRYSNRFVPVQVHTIRGTTILSVPLGQWWLAHKDRQQYRGVVFRPGAPIELNDCLNLWQGWGVEAKAGDWSLIKWHIKHVIAGGDEVFADYVVKWIAWAIQHPDAQAEVALVLIGLKGVGKGTLVRCLQRIFGPHAFQVTSREEVIGKFNGHLQDCILFIADEAYWGGDKRCVGRLQGMITEPTLPIERKGIDLIQVPNFLHVVMLAEPGWVIPAGRYERRYAALAVSKIRQGDKPYFRALNWQIVEGGAEAMFYDLGRMDLADWHPREIPKTLLSNEALQKQQGFTLPPIEQWYVSLLHDGVLPGALVNRPNKSFTHSLIEDAKDKIPRLRLDLTDVALRDFLTNEESIGIPCDKFRTSSANGWSFAPLLELRDAWSRRYGPTK